MKESNRNSLVYADNLLPYLIGLKPLNKRSRPTRVALLVLLLLTFAAAAISLTVWAGDLNRGEATPASVTTHTPSC